MSERNVQGLITFIGFVISVIAIVYFAVEFIPELSEWGQLAALVLLAVAFAAFAYYVQSTTVGGPFFDIDRLRWLRPAVVFYLLAVVAGVIAEFVFIGIDTVPRPVKVLVSLAVGVGLVFYAARGRFATAS